MGGAMTTTRKIHYGADVWINPCDSAFTFWEAAVNAVELERVTENGYERWKSVSNRAVQLVKFTIHGSDLNWSEDPQKRATLGFYYSSPGWHLNTRYESQVLVGQAEHAIKLIRKFQRKEQKLRTDYGAPRDFDHVIKRAILSIWPEAVRFQSDYTTMRVDAETVWRPRGDFAWLGSAIRAELQFFEERLREARPSLFPREGVAS